MSPVENEVLIKKIMMKQEKTKPIFWVIVMIPTLFGLIPGVMLWVGFMTGGMSVLTKVLVLICSILGVMLMVKLLSYITHIIWAFGHVFLVKSIAPNLKREEARHIMLKYYIAKKNSADKLFKGRSNTFRTWCYRLTESAIKMAYQA